MRKLEVILLLLVLIILAISPFTLALFHNDDGNESAGDEDNESDSDNPLPPPPTPIEPTGTAQAAYQCLENLIDEKDQSDLSLQEAVFSTLALGSDSKLRGVIEDAEDDSCWPSPSCTIKETAQVVLAYERINKNTDDIEAWLTDNSGTATELTWFLQIDISNHQESACTITYQDTDRIITINEDMTLSGNGGLCLAISNSGFWLRVNDNCIDETFRVSCDEDFITSLLYQREGTSTIYVSPITNSASALGTTEEKINSKCFKITGSCDYEGSLWAALALDQTGNEIAAYLPYLLALASENQRFFPSTFLYVLAQGDDQYSNIIQSQQQNQYWQAINTQYNRFYDSSLAMLALQNTGAAELTSAQSYLLGIQTPEGCWNSNNIRDTAFVLYSGWPQSVGGGGGGGGTTPPSCVSQGYDCTSSLFTCTDVGGSILDFDCDFGVCCSVSLQLQPCSAQNGIVCSASQTCSGLVVDSLDGSCCLDSCQELPQSNECQLVGGGCFSSCTEDEEQLSESCEDASLICCKVKDETEKGGGGIWKWIILIIILIVLVVLGIIFEY